jgi:hypothetical protein
VVVDEFTGGVCVEYVRDAGGGEREGLCLLVDGDGGRCGRSTDQLVCETNSTCGLTLVRHDLIES